MNNIIDLPDVSSPEPELERTGRIVSNGDRRAIAMLFETHLDGDRVNLLLARIYSAAENAEREVKALGDKAVADIVAGIRDSAEGR